MNHEEAIGLLYGQNLKLDTPIVDSEPTVFVVDNLHLGVFNDVASMCPADPVLSRSPRPFVR